MSEQVVTYTATGLGSEEADRRYESALKRVEATFPRRVASAVDGESVRTAAVVPDVFPGNPRLRVAEVHEAAPSSVNAAVAAARRGFRDWSRAPWTERVATLRRVADTLEAERFDLAAVISWETGKVRVEAVGEVDEAVALIRYYARCYEDEHGFDLRMGDGSERASSVMRPWGVWGVISPFNFPLALATGMLAGILLGGNTAVFKPSSKTALIGRRLFDHMAASLPPGAVQFLAGDAAIGSAMVDHPGLDGFAFTGSREVGLAAIPVFSRHRPRPFIAEMGGKNPVIVGESADLQAATEGIVRSAYSLSGQKCSAASRVYVVRSRAEELLDRLGDAIRSLVVGQPWDRRTFVGPVIDSAARDRFAEAVAAAQRDGRVVVGGRVLQEEPFAHGWFVEPTLVTDLRLNHEHLHRELFLPYLVVAPVDSFAQAVAEANSVPYGLTAGLFSDDPAEAERFLEEIQAGTVYVNRARGATTGAWPGVQPFGGWKDSGSTGRHALGPRYVQQFLREQSRTIAD